MEFIGVKVGHYRIERPLGDGGMGTVYLAEDQNIPRKVALKMIRTDMLFSSNSKEAQEALRLFKREAQAIARFDHPHILPLYDYNTETIQGINIPYMVMPFCPDGSLATSLQKSSRLSPKMVARLLLQIADALVYAHDRQIIHRDVKPANILLRQRNNTNFPDALLADFGIAAILDGTTSTGKVIRGSPLYMAPEQWNGQPTFATDQYALAVIVYQLLTGETPFQGDQQQLMYQHCNVDPQPPSSLNPSLPLQLDSILLKALAKKPEDRFSSVLAFAQAFRDALQRSSLIFSSKIENGRLQRFDQSLKASIFLTALLGTIAYIISPFGSLTLYPSLGLILIGISWVLGLFESIRLKQWGWFLGFLLLSPIAGILFGLLPSSNRKSTSFEDIFVTNAKQVRWKLLGWIGIALVIEIIGLGILTSFSTGQAFDNMMVNKLVAITHTKPLIDDPLNDPFNKVTHSDEWAITSGCTFADQSYQSSDVCTLGAKSFSNFSLQVEMRLLSLNNNANTAYGGILWRYDKNLKNDYWLWFRTDGAYGLDYDRADNFSHEVVHGSTSLFKTQLGQKNVIAIIIKDDQFDIYVNGQYLASATDDSFGAEGLIALDGAGAGGGALFNNLKIWSI